MKYAPDDPLGFALPTLLPDRWVSIDPGDVHVGVTTWSGSECLRSWETTPNRMLDMLDEASDSGKLDLVVYEKFQLYGDRMGQQIGSEFKTSEMIGAMRFICRRRNVPMRRYLSSHHKAMYKLKAFRPPQMPLRAWKSYGSGGHAKDSECLGYYWIKQVSQRNVK